MAVTGPGKAKPLDAYDFVLKEALSLEMVADGSTAFGDFREDWTAEAFLEWILMSQVEESQDAQMKHLVSTVHKIPFFV